MNLFGRALTLLAAVTGLAGVSCTPATPTYTIKYAELRGKMDNGLRMVVIPDKNTPMAHVAVRYEVGANEDPPGKAGLAHLVEHMMFQHRFLGPDKPPTFQIIPQIATGFNAWTNWDTTHYYLTGRAEDVDKMLRIEAARMGAICETIPEAEFEREREVVRNEIRQRGGTPEGLIQAILLEAAYPPGHAYHQTIGGNDAQLSSITFKDVCDFLTNYYTPDRATVVVAGNVDAKEMAKKIADEFGGIPPRKAAPRKPVAPMPKYTYAKTVKDLNTERSSVFVIWPLPPRTSDDYPAGRSMIGAVNQRLGYFNEQYDFAAGVGAFPFGGELAPVMVVTAELYKAGDADEVLDWIWKSTSGIHRGFEDGMFSDESSAIGKAALITAMESLDDRATFIADQVQFQNKVDFGSDKEYLFAALEQYDKLDGGRFRDFMKSRLSKDNAKVVVIKSSKSGLKGDKRAALKFSGRSHDQDQTPLVDPAEAQRPLPAPETKSILNDAVQYTLGNGMKVILLPFDGLPIVTTRLIFAAGGAHEPADKAGLADITASFLRSPMDSNIGQIGIRIGGSANLDTTTFQSHGINIYLEPLIKGLERLVKAGEIRQEVIESWQRYQKLEFDSERFRRNRAFQLEAAKAIFGPDHPYAIKGSPTENTYKRIGRDVAMDFKDHYSAKNATLIVVGSFKLESAKSIISGSFGDWGGGRQDKPIAAEARPRTGPEYYGVVEPEEVPQMTVQIAYPAPAGIGGDEAARRVLAAMLNLRMAEIRTKLGSTYGTYAARPPRVGPTAYVMGGTVDATRGGESLKAMRDAVDSLRRGENFDRDFATARRTVLKSLLAESTDTRSLAGRLANIATYGLSLDYYDQQVKATAAVSPAQVRAIMETELDPSHEILGLMADRPTLENTFKEAGIETVRYIEPQ
ncbi:MAG TPA: insulinase family protein [Kofleriaceae bacterium]|nr:insulinase family protein [Kofleriaceae bacterium]